MLLDEQHNMCDFEEQTNIPIAIDVFPTNQSKQILYNASFKKFFHKLLSVDTASHFFH